MHLSIFVKLIFSYCLYTLLAKVIIFHLRFLSFDSSEAFVKRWAKPESQLPENPWISLAPRSLVFTKSRAFLSTGLLILVDRSVVALTLSLEG